MRIEKVPTAWKSVTYYTLDELNTMLREYIHKELYDYWFYAIGENNDVHSSAYKFVKHLVDEGFKKEGKYSSAEIAPLINNFGILSGEWRIENE